MPYEISWKVDSLFNVVLYFFFFEFLWRGRNGFWIDKGAFKTWMVKLFKRMYEQFLNVFTVIRLLKWAPSNVFCWYGTDISICLCVRFSSYANLFRWSSCFFHSSIRNENLKKKQLKYNYVSYVHTFPLFIPLIIHRKNKLLVETEERTKKNNQISNGTPPPSPSPHIIVDIL